VSAAPSLDAPTSALHFRVTGMRCASCAARVEGVLRDQPGVNDASVNFATGEARVEGANDIPALASALADAGYGLESRSGSAPPAAPASDRRRPALAALLTAPVFALAMLGIDSPASRIVQALLTTGVVYGLGAPFHRGAWARARHLGANMDTLISVGTTAAYATSLAALVTGGPLYFETAAVIVTLILIGRFLEDRARGRASSAVTRLAALRPTHASVVRDGREVQIALDAVQVGDHLAIRPGEKVATDAVILEGRSAFDESAFTGESLPVDKGPGDTLFGASLNRQGFVVARATRVGRDTALAGIIRLVEEAQASKAPIQKLADRVASVFVPVVLTIALVTGLAWFAVGADVNAALANAVAVLVIACPCALGLATPTAILVGSGRGAELGVLFKNAEVFEQSRRVDTVVFDKTGTLTRGEMSLTDVLSEDDDFLGRVAAVEAGSEHPIAGAVVAGARERGAPQETLREFESLPGRGVRGRVGDVTVSVGTERWMQELGVDVPSSLRDPLGELEAAGRTVFVGAWGGRARGLVAVADTPRTGAVEAVESLRAGGIGVVMITGDNQRTASAVATQLGIDRVMAEVLPADKADAVAELQASGHRVAFVGDGINDAPALTRADLGMAVGTGTDVAIEAGGVVLVAGDPRLCGVALALARRTFGTIAQNLFWAFGYNAAAIPLAALGYLDPMIAAGAMALSSLSVVANSLRLRRFQA